MPSPTSATAGGAFDRVDARKHGSGRVEERVSYPSTMNRRWEHPCNVRFGRDVVNIPEAADVFLRDHLSTAISPSGSPFFANVVE